jgi:hypothetical protein
VLSTALPASHRDGCGATKPLTGGFRAFVVALAPRLLKTSGAIGAMKMRVTVIGIALAALLGTAAQAREFGGYDCSDDCSGHAAGYRWAEAHSITDESECPHRGGASSFYEGCLVYVEDPNRGADEDDDGDDID